MAPVGAYLHLKPVVMEQDRANWPPLVLKGWPWPHREAGWLICSPEATKSGRIVFKQHSLHTGCQELVIGRAQEKKSCCGLQPPSRQRQNLSHSQMKTLPPRVGKAWLITCARLWCKQEIYLYFKPVLGNHCTVFPVAPCPYHPISLAWVFSSLKYWRVVPSEMLQFSWRKKKKSQLLDLNEHARGRRVTCNRTVLSHINSWGHTSKEHSNKFKWYSSLICAGDHGF